MLESSCDEDSNSETDLLMATVGMVNEELLLLPRRGGSSKKQEANVDHNLEDGHVRLYKDYFDPDMVNPLDKEKAFPRRYIGCPEKCLWSFSMARETMMTTLVTLVRWPGPVELVPLVYIRV
jgi:hypothetical protein